MPVSYNNQTSMQRRFIVFSYILFLFIFLLGSVIFINLMREIHYKNSRYELMQTIEINRLKLEVSENSEIDEDLYLFNAGGEIIKARDVSLLGLTSEEILAKAKGLKIREIEYFETNTDKNGAQMIAEKLLKKIRECKIPHKASDVADYVTISIGGTTGIVNYSQNPQDYIKAADKALYESKKNGRNRYTYEDYPTNSMHL